MKIVQITTGHVEQGCEPDLFGLDEQGNVYIYRRKVEPWVTKEWVAPPPIPYPAPVPIQWVAAPEPSNPNLGIDPFTDKSIRPIPKQAQALKDIKEDINEICGMGRTEIQRYLKAQEIQQMQVERRPAPPPPQGHYIDVYHDGYTEGWEPLAMGMSKTVPHKDDPTKCERC